METKKVYLAGKISPNGWRQKIVDIRNNFYDFDCYKDPSWYKTLLKFDEEIYITGPYFMSCDHSCYHGEGSHGVGVGVTGMCGCPECNGPKMSEKDVIKICELQIFRSDIIFAFINDNSCYGSLFELGLAKALGKKIIVVFDNDKRKKDMWFIGENADYSTSIDEFKLCKTNNILENLDNKHIDFELKNLATKFIEKLI